MTTRTAQDPYSIVVELVPDKLDGSLGPSTRATPAKIAEGSEKALYKENRNHTLECRVVHLQHGTLHNEPAVLVAFEFQFTTPVLSSSRRIVSADIDISFDCDTITPDATTFRAKVVNYAPAFVEGPPTDVTKETELLFKPNLASPGPVQAGLEFGFSERTTFVEKQALQVQGSASSSDTRNEVHRARWQVKENRATKKGIPHVFRTAALVRTRERVPLLCSLRLEVFSGRRRLLGVPWSADQPLVMEPDAAVGSALGSPRFEELQERDWEELLQISYPTATLQITRDPRSVLLGDI
ncbi:hypothetical protein NEMBOFW57_001278 [Staphylotrichum longicolle]|uniref:Uncharacterized protein n=1 Tax=Staphylotrichum longicolle TaxID=669026 RepID=A0AAD4F0V3_9PEZI|nr:hypothetical protein NEMBOFW57_001278 [Staphylotrichum longicolle]